MTLEPTAYHHKLLNEEAGLIVSERLTLSPRFPVHIGELDNREGLHRETEPLVPLAKALDYAAALVAAERERCAKVCEQLSRTFSEPAYAGGPTGAFSEMFACGRCAAAIREGGEHD